MGGPQPQLRTYEPSADHTPPHSLNSDPYVSSIQYDLLDINCNGNAHMTIPDQVHINQVRDALWSRPSAQASVMVGAGFSRNAEKARPDAGLPPLWHEITNQICRTLYQPNDGGRLQKALSEASATGGFLKLAQEYDAAFGRNALHKLIKHLVPDDDFRHGEMHVRLLTLPWRDVFTTNWDTLLESARPDVTARPYSLVQTTADISSATPPRIVKLHGSLPSHYPLIVTEEDYRTYPRKFAPFVNTVQQAMMETIVLLIGFSGEDPNFLHWSGWVRDNMGLLSPKIYLAGWLDLSAHRRQVLTNGNVVPIDLAHHPMAATWPEHLRDRYAADWILHTLECGRPYNPADWPMPTEPKQGPILDILQPVELPPHHEPQEEPSVPSSPDDTEQTLDAVRDILKAWRHNRIAYPGWLTVPGTEQDKMRNKTDEWEPWILGAAPRLNPIDRLDAVRELVWRREALTDRMSSELEQTSSDVLEAVDCETRTLAGTERPDLPWGTIRESWRFVALALVTVARQRFDQECFEQRIRVLSPFIDDHEDVRQRLFHERGLCALYAMDFAAMSDVLEKWRTESSDPVWKMRKASILAEMNRDDEANRLIRIALNEIRQHPSDERSLAGPSREGWALFLAEAFEHEAGDWGQRERRLKRYYRRSAELAVLQCDALDERRICAERMRGHSGDEEEPDFDDGTPQKRFVFSEVRASKSDAARRAIRLTEVVGLPPAANRITIASDLMEHAADELAIHEPRLAASLVLRACHYDGQPILKRVLSKTRIASMPTGAAEAIAKSCLDIMNFGLPRIRNAGGLFWVERLRVALEVLSRVALRSRVEVIVAAFDKAMEYYMSKSIAGHPWLNGPIRNLFTRCWTAMSVSHRTDRVLELIAAPVVGMGGFQATSAGPQQIDPGELLGDEVSPPQRTTGNSHQWTSVVSQLTHCLRSGGEARRRASIRIGYAGLYERLTEDEKAQVADALWHPISDSLPVGTIFPDWAFLLLPQPRFGLAEERFRAKWLDRTTIDLDLRGPRKKPYVIPLDSPENDDSGDPNSIISQVGSAIWQTRTHDQSLSLNEEDRGVLGDLVRWWADTETPPPDSNVDVGLTRLAVLGLRRILSDVRISESVAERLYWKVRKLHESKIPAFELIGVLAGALPDRLDELATTMRTGLVAEDDTFPGSAGGGLYVWITESIDSESHLPQPPEDLVREVGVAIATRRAGVLEWALRIASWIFSEGNQSQRGTIEGLTLQGLQYLAGSLGYDRQRYDLGIQERQVPELRERCAQLALTMGNAGYHQEPAIARWLKTVEEDPLPQVRYARPLSHGSRSPPEGHSKENHK